MSAMSDLTEKQLDQLAEYVFGCLTNKDTLGSYRHLIYSVLSPEVGYGEGMDLGLLTFNNILCDLEGRIQHGKKV